MLHRHFEQEKQKNITTLKDVEPKEEFVSEIFPPNEAENKETKKRGRPKKTEE